MGDYCDGDLFKSHPLFGEDPCALQIQLYYDEVEFCNPIGSRRGVHKLGEYNLHAVFVHVHACVCVCMHGSCLC